MGEGKTRFYDFGEFRVDARRRILLKNGEPLTLSPRNFDLLLELVEHEGTILTHDELLDRVWEGTFVEQANLKNAVSVIRRVLGEGSNEGAYIRTVPRRGYSFVAQVKRVADGDAAATIVYSETESEVTVEEVWVDSEQHAAATDVASDRRELAAPPIGERSSFPKRLAVIGSLAVLGIAAIFVVRAFVGQSKAIAFSADIVRISKLTAEGDLIGGDASISPNGKYLVYAVRQSDGASLWTRQIATGVARQISPVLQGSIWACTLTPDEDFIYYTFNSNTDRSKSGLYRISTFGGSAQRISDNIGGAQAISPDGTRLAVVHVTPELVTNIETIDREGGDLKVVWTNSGDVRIWDLKYSVDGKTLLYTVRKTLPDRSVYYVAEIPLDGGPERVILPQQEKQVADAIMLPDKKSLLLSIRELNAEVRQIWQYFIETREWKRVTNDNASYRGISLTKDGRKLVVSQETRLTTMWASPTGGSGDLVQVMPGTHYLITAAWTNDGRIVYSGIENSAEAANIINADGTGSRPLTAGEDGIWVFPWPSRDGSHVAYVSARTGRRQIWTMNNDGRDQQQLTNLESGVYDGCLLADGRSAIVVQTVTPKRSSVVLVQADGTARTLVADHTNRWGLSPDEKFVAAMADDPQTHKTNVRIVSVESGEVVKTFDLPANRVLKWMSDGLSLAYDSVGPDGGKIMLQPIDGSPAKTYMSLPGEEVFSFDWNYAGNKFVLVRGKHLTDAVEISIDAGK